MRFNNASKRVDLDRFVRTSERCMDAGRVNMRQKIQKGQMTEVLRQLQIRRMADELVGRFENEEVDFDWLRPRLQALIEGRDFVATDKVTPKKRDLAHERYDEVIQFWTDLIKPADGTRPMVDDWKYFITLPREHGKLLSNRQIRENRQQGWELFYMPGKTFAMFDILDYFVCNNLWKAVFPSYPKLSQGPGYWYWAKTSPTAELNRPDSRRVACMNILEYMVCFEMTKWSGKCVWDQQTTTIVNIGDERLWVVGSTVASQRIRNFGSILPNVVEDDSGFREVWRLNA